MDEDPLAELRTPLYQARGCRSQLQTPWLPNAEPWIQDVSEVPRKDSSIWSDGEQIPLIILEIVLRFMNLGFWEVLERGPNSFDLSGIKKQLPWTKGVVACLIDPEESKSPWCFAVISRRPERVELAGRINSEALEKITRRSLEILVESCKVRPPFNRTWQDSMHNLFPMVEMIYNMCATSVHKDHGLNNLTQWLYSCILDPLLTDNREAVISNCHELRIEISSRLLGQPGANPTGFVKQFFALERSPHSGLHIDDVGEAQVNAAGHLATDNAEQFGDDGIDHRTINGIEQTEIDDREQPENRRAPSRTCTELIMDVKANIKEAFQELYAGSPPVDLSQGYHSQEPLEPQQHKILFMLFEPEQAIVALAVLLKCPSRDQSLDIVVYGDRREQQVAAEKIRRTLKESLGMDVARFLPLHPEGRIDWASPSFVRQLRCDSVDIMARSYDSYLVPMRREMITVEFILLLMQKAIQFLKMAKVCGDVITQEGKLLVPEFWHEASAIVEQFWQVCKKFMTTMGIDKAPIKGISSLDEHDS